MKVPILSERDIETATQQLLSDYSSRTRTPVSPPVPIERLIDVIFDIPILWEPIPPHHGRLIVSKILQPRLNEPARIVLNEDLRHTMFATCPGLEQTALAHEAGHGHFHLDHSRLWQLDFYSDIDHEFVSDADTFADPLFEVRSRVGPIGDDGWREWQAHTFMRYLLMPRRLLVPALRDYRHLTWPALYQIRDRFQVTISALVVHLEKLDIARVDERRQIHDLTPQAKGQLSLEL